MNLQNKIAVITGAGSGIGRALSIALAKEGCQLALCDLNLSALEETANSCTKTAPAPLLKKLDVSQKAEFEQFADAIVQQFGRVDIMVNNAGIALGKFSGIDVPESEFRKLMEVNFWGMVYGSQVFLPYLIKQQEASLVNISSLFGLTGIAFQAPYCASKFAIRGYTESLMMELGRTAPHVTITSVHPGGVKTNISQSSIPGDPGLGNHEKFVKRFEKNLRLPAEQAAQIILKGIKTKKSRVIVGSDARIVDRIIRYLPNRAISILQKRLK